MSYRPLSDIEEGPFSPSQLRASEPLGHDPTDPGGAVVRENGREFPSHEHSAMVALRTGHPMRDVVTDLQRPADGGTVWSHIDATPQFQPGKREPHPVFSTFSDITERREAERKVEAFERAMRVVSTRTSRGRILVVEDEALIALDLERRLSRAGYHVVGTADNPDEAVGMFRELHPDLVLMDIFIRGPVDGIETARAICQFGDVPVIFLTAYADDDTVQRAAEISPYGYLLKPFDDRTLLATITVAVERHAADTRLRLLDAAVSSATVGIQLVEAHDDQRRVSFVNDAFLSLSGFSREKVLGQPLCFLAHESSEEAVGRLREALENRTHARETVLGRGLTRDFWSTVTISPVANRSGRINHLLLFHVDVTREREAQSAFAESQRLEVVGQLSAGIAHDFNNVLTAILAFTDLARNSVEDEGVRGDLDEVLHAVKRGALLTRKLLGFSRRNEISPVGSADLSRVVGEARQLAERLAGPGVTVELRIDPEPMFVALDPTSLEQILLNLVANARDAMPGGGKIVVAVTRPVEPSGSLAGRCYVRLGVTDDGTGMDAATAGRIFNAFFTTKPRGLGTGLGLSTCKMLVEQAGGTIGVRTAPGEGSTFVLDFPLTENPASEITNTLAEAVGGNAGGATCLLVEDEGPLRRAGARALSAAGFTVIEASNGEAACREIEALGSTLRLLICDMVLPGLGGAEVLACARKSSPQAELLVVTGYLDHSLETLGPVSTLWKPFNSSALARRALDLINVGATTSDERPAEATPAPSVAPAPALDPRSPVVLLIEDDNALRRALAAMLEAQSLRVVEANTGAAGLAAFEAEEVQLAVLDVNLPDVDGIEVLAAIRKRDALLPTLVMTGEPSVETAQRALRGRATAFLTKPIAPKAFVEEVERAMNEGQVARLQHKLLMSKASLSAMLTDVAATEHAFNESVRGLHMAFQPIVRANDLSIFAYEALMRSRGPYVNPGEMLAAAEALGRVTDLGRAVRRSIASTLAEHPERCEPIFVNLHPMELSAYILMHEDEPLLPFTSRIVLEVTERAQLSSVQDLAETLRVLRTAGYRVALDDLGEGYAGLSWLVKLTPDISKLDMSLVRDIQGSRMKRDLVGSLVSVCRRARTLVVAEGVETAAEAEVLRDMGCDLLQGYHFARPAPPFPEVSGPTPRALSRHDTEAQ
jgi:PAS domain S-box-containing protein